MPENKPKVKTQKSKVQIKEQNLVEKATEKEAVTKKDISKKQIKNDFSIPAYDLAGKESGVIKLPQEIFGAKVNKQLLAQAAHVYIANQKRLPGFTKTRGEVNLTTKKWFRQKGTGRARHGAQSAPIFVGGGIAMGPKPRIVRLDLPKKMKKAALISALSVRMGEHRIVGLVDSDKANAKTKQLANFMVKLWTIMSDKKPVKTLIVTNKKGDMVMRMAKNLQKVNTTEVSQLNVADVINNEIVMFTKEAIATFEHKKTQEVSANE